MFYQLRVLLIQNGMPTIYGTQVLPGDRNVGPDVCHLGFTDLALFYRYEFETGGD